MNAATAMELAQDEIIAMLESAGLIDGEKATQAQSNSEILFWDTPLKSKGASDKQSYVVWALVSTDKKTSADNQVRAREAFASYEVYTRRTKTSKQVRALICALNEKAIEKGWQFEYSGPSEYERETAIYHMTFNLYKIFK